MSKRIEWLHALARLIAGRQWDACPEVLYRILYGLPSDRLMSLTVDTLKRYLPIFEKRWPAATWPRQILKNPAMWTQQFGRQVPEEPSPDHPGDASYLFCFDALLLGWVYRTEAGILTSSSACAILESIDAHTQNAKIEYASKPDQQMVADAVCGREWQYVLDWLHAHNLLASPDTPTDALERDLATWKEHAMLLIVPESARLWS